jgi:hypothetical protein
MPEKRDNNAVHRRTACAVSPMETHSSVLGDGHRSSPKSPLIRQCLSWSPWSDMRHWHSTDVVTVYHGDTFIGTAKNLSAVQPWMFADFQPSPAANAYREFFEACTDDESELPEPGGRYPVEYLDDSMWSVVDSGGSKHGICLPAIHWSDGDIAWRWRDGDDM